ncbi:MAG TPA: TonB-dependent receptor, partial [Hanamia sp.]|nr:TonB-dependent receptor [Hanamia sp.]
MIINHFYLTILFLFVSTSLMAQYPKAGGYAKSGTRNMNLGHFYGKVVDANTNKPIDAASVQLMHNKWDSASKQSNQVIVAAMLTDKKGEFSIDKLPVFGTYQILISAVGHTVYNEKISFNLKMNGGDMSQMVNAIDKDLGNIKMQPQPKELAAVVVTANKPLMQMSIDRKVFNVSQSLTSVGGTAVDVMRNVPSVNVDIDGNVTLRNATPQIFVDGRPTTLTLDEIPADEIESIEIITNPSAKFDASGGGAGILNIVMKKNKKPGYNGNLRAGVDTRLGSNLGGNLNIRQGKINFFASGNYFHFKSKGTTINNRVDNVNGTQATLLQKGDQDRNGRMIGGNLGFDYFMDNRNTFTLSSGIRRGKFGNTQLLNIIRDTTFDPDNSIHNTGTSNSNGNFTWNNYNGRLSFKHNFAKPNKNITADVNYDYSKNTNLQDIATQYYNADNTPNGLLTDQRTSGAGTSNNLTIQTDYTNPITDKIKLEAGLRGAIRNSNSNNQNFLLDPSSGKYEGVAALNSNYKYKDQVYAGYVTFSQMIHNFTYQLGGRLESSDYGGELIDSNQVFKNSFPLSFFPSVFLTQKINDKQDIQLNYSRKINRPNFWQLIPYYDFSDPLNISKGNASLVPEFTNLLELSYNINFKNGNNLIATAYYRGTNNLISRYQYWDKNPNPAYNDSVFVSSYVNANSSTAYGLEITSLNRIAPWWSLTSNVNFYNSQINSSNLQSTPGSQRVSWFGKLNSTFTLPESITFQITGDYTSKTILPPGRGGSSGSHWGGGDLSTANGYSLPKYGFDAAIKKDFLKNKSLSVSLSVNDIFRTRITKTHSESMLSKNIYSVQDIDRQRDPQKLRLNLSWRFGKTDFTLF